MAPSALTATVRGVPEGTRKIYWVPTIATQASPTRAELNAGIDLTTEIAEMGGFTVSSETEDVPDLSSRYVGKVPSRITSPDSTIRFYTSSNSNDVRASLVRDQAGFIVCLWDGDVGGQKMDVFPVKIASVSVQTSISDPASVEYAFSITKVPSQYVSIPA